MEDNVLPTATKQPDLIRPTVPWVGSALPTELPCSREHLPASESGVLPRPHFSICRLHRHPQSSHQDDTQADFLRGNPQGRDKWHSGEYGWHAREDTALRVRSLRLWKMSGAQPKGPHLTHSCCSRYERQCWRAGKKHWCINFLFGWCSYWSKSEIRHKKQ